MSDAFWIALFGCIASIGAVLLSYRNGRKAEMIDKKVDEVHGIVNSQRTTMEQKIAALELTVRQLTSRSDAFKAGQESIKTPPAV